MKAILVRYNNDIEWLEEYNFDLTLYDRSEKPLGYAIRTKNIGQVDYDKLGYLIENYDNLPDVFLWGKANLLKSITKEEFEVVKDNQFFTPLLTQKHKTYLDNLGWVCYYNKEGIYCERNNSWFFNNLPSRYVKSFNEWATRFGLPKLDYIPFAPGGNYILTREKVHRYPRDFYEEMRSLLPYTENPVEAHCAERSYYLMWQ